MKLQGNVEENSCRKMLQRLKTDTPMGCFRVPIMLVMAQQRKGELSHIPEAHFLCLFVIMRGEKISCFVGWFVCLLLLTSVCLFSMESQNME